MFPTNNTFNCYVKENLEASDREVVAMMNFARFGFTKKIDHRFSMTTTLYSLKICNVSMNAHIQWCLQCTYSSYISNMHILLKNSFVPCLDRMITHNLNTNTCIHNLHAYIYYIHTLYVCNFLSYLHVERKCISSLLLYLI